MAKTTEAKNVPEVQKLTSKHMFGIRTFSTEKRIGKSLTRPGMAKNIGEQLKRLQRGEQMEEYLGYYESELGVKLPDFNKMTRIEKLEYTNDVRNKMAKAKTTIEEQIKKKQKELGAKQAENAKADPTAATTAEASATETKSTTQRNK